MKSEWNYELTPTRSSGGYVVWRLGLSLESKTEALDDDDDGRLILVCISHESVELSMYGWLHSPPYWYNPDTTHTLSYIP